MASATALLHVYRHDSHRAHHLPGHPERPERVDALTEGLEVHASLLHWHDTSPAPREALLRVHPEPYLQHVEAACRTGTDAGPEAWTTPGTWGAILDAAGGAIAAADRAMTGEPAFALIRPPGHHAGPDHAMGFCHVDHVAVAAAHHADQGHRVMILDIDVHHGNGTQDIFYARDDVLYVSVHEDAFYPGTGHVHEAGAAGGEGFNVNLPVPAGTGHQGWLHVVERAVWPLLGRYAPDLVLVSAGFDGHYLDPLASLRLIAETYHAFFAALRDRAPHIALVLEGGYDLAALRLSGHAVVAGLTGAAAPHDPPVPEGPDPWATLAPRLRAAHGRWDFGR